MDSFKKSYSSYIETGTKEATEAVIDVLINEPGGRPVTAEFKAKLRKIIMDHRLRKLHNFYSHLTSLTTFVRLNTAHPADQDAA